MLGGVNNTSCQIKLETVCASLTNDSSGKMHTACKRLRQQMNFIFTCDSQATSEQLQDAHFMGVLSIY